MIGKSPNGNQPNLFLPLLKEMLDPRRLLYKLADEIPWSTLENELKKYYREDFGAPSKPIRLMASLLILKQLENLSDETLVERWAENPYYQYFSGQVHFTWKMPCDPSDITHFRKRIGKEGVEKIFAVSIEIHGEDAQEKYLSTDTTVMEKNITYPTDIKLHRRIADHCVEIMKQADIAIRQSYQRTLPALIKDQRFKRNAKTAQKARKSARKIKTIAKRLVNELKRKLSPDLMIKYNDKIETFDHILNQKREDKNKIYSIHAPEVCCISKGKEHKKFEFGAKCAIAMTWKSGIIVGAKSYQKNIYDGKTLPDILAHVEAMRGLPAAVVIGDRSYRGANQIGQTQVLTPKPLGKTATRYEKRKMRIFFRRRAAIEPCIGHLKNDHRVDRNYLKGALGDEINLLMACAAYNFKKWMNKAARLFASFFYRFQIRVIFAQSF